MFLGVTQILIKYLDYNIVSADSQKSYVHHAHICSI